MTAPLPDGHRIAFRFCWAPILIAGAYRWLETVRVVERLQREPGRPSVDCENYRGISPREAWVVVGFYDELYPIKPASPCELCESGEAP